MNNISVNNNYNNNDSLGPAPASNYGTDSDNIAMNTNNNIQNEQNRENEIVNRYQKMHHLTTSHDSLHGQAPPKADFKTVWGKVKLLALAVFC